MAGVGGRQGEERSALFSTLRVIRGAQFTALPRSSPVFPAPSAYPVSITFSVSTTSTAPFSGRTPAPYHSAQTRVTSAPKSTIIDV